MTAGGEPGTNGQARDERQGAWRPWLFIAAVTLVVTTVNASSDMLEIRRAGLKIGLWEPIVWEVTSGIVILAVTPLIGWAVRRWTPTRDDLLRPGLIHLGLTVPFAATHVAAIYVMRTAIYAAVGVHYGFFDDGVGIVLFYEWRKDVLSYAAIAATYWIFQYIAARREAVAPASADARIELRDGAAAVFLAPAEISHVEAAGNYVEFHTETKTHLVRGTLAAWEGKLTANGFVRVHRSRLVNRARIVGLKPTPSGDVEITLSDGKVVAGSRRYRAALAGE